jgi:hypothetical protein
VTIIDRSSSAWLKFRKESGSSDLLIEGVKIGASGMMLRLD